MKKNCKSKIGTEYNFENIKSIEEYKEKVPITDYSFYQDYIEKMEKGEKNILISEKVEYFGRTSGTTGKQKLIPTCKSSRRIASKYMAVLLTRYAYNYFKEKWNNGKGLLIADITMTSYSEGGVPICSATSGGMNSIKYIMNYLYTSPLEVFYIEDRETALYLHILYALGDYNLLYISGVFISNVVDLFRVLEKNYESLVKDIRMGSISKKLNIDYKTRNKLNSLLSPNAARANYLEKEFNKGFEGIARRIWPHLTYIATVTGANFSIYDNKLNYYTDYIPIYSPVYASTEGTIGINPYVKKIEYVIIPDTVFYEFIPIEEDRTNNPKTLCLWELKKNGVYEIIITTYSGLYRYRLSDVIRVVDFYNGSPSIEFLYRKNQVLNMVSEKTNEEHLTVAIKNTMKTMDMNVVDYTTLPDNTLTPGRYIIFLELKTIVNNKQVKVMEEKLEEELQKSNLSYARARKSRKLEKLKLNVVKENTFDAIKEVLFTNGVSKNQVKIPRVTNNNLVIKILIENICS